MQVIFATPANVTLIVGLLVLASAASVWTYWWLRPSLPRRRWLVLLALRLSAVSIAAMLLARPVVSITNASRSKPTVCLLLDRSASMSIRDLAGGRSRWRAVTSRLPAWWAKLEPTAALRLFVFGDTVRPLESLGAIETLEANATATSLVEAVRVLSQLENLQAAVLISDGQHNAAGDPVAVAESLGVPVYTVGVGSSAVRQGGLRDVQVVDLALPDELPLNNQVRARVLVDAFGCEGIVVPVLLMEDGRKVAETELRLDGRRGAQEVELTFAPKEEGLHTYAAEVPPRPFERIPQNNRRTTMARVTARQIRVFYVEGTLRAEYGALVEHFLARDPDIVFLAMVQIRPNVFLTRTNMDQFRTIRSLPRAGTFWSAFDVVIIGDIDASYWTQQVLEGLRERVREGAGLLLLGGYHALGPGGYAETPIAELLPVDLIGKNAGQVEEDFHPVLTVAGEGHDIFTGLQGFFPTSSRPAQHPLPPLRGATRVGATRPTGIVLLEYRPHSGGSMPVLAVGVAGKGRTAVFAADTTRLWYQATRALGRQSPFVRFWGQLVRWLAGRGTSTATLTMTARTTKPWYRPGEIVQIEAEARDEEGAGTNDAAIAATLTGPGGKRELKLDPLGTPPGKYTGSVPDLPPGKYTIVVQGKLGDHTFEPVELQVEIGRPNLEFDNVTLNAELLKALANATGGQYVPLELVDRVLDELRLQIRQRVVVREVPLAWPPGCWTLFVLALSAEWFLRRKWRLR